MNFRTTWAAVGTGSMTAWLIAVLQVVETLLAKGAQVNAKSNKGVTALMFASMRGKPDIVQVLLDKGADVNAMSKDGRTAFGVASTFGHREIQEILIEAGAMDVWSLWWRLKHYFSLLTNYPERR